MKLEHETITLGELEDRLLCFYDTKKKLIFIETAGWGWQDKDEEYDEEASCFETAWEAILDATQPYFDKDSDE
jgi:hypothetical protein